MSDTPGRHDERRFGVLCALLSEGRDPFAAAGPIRKLAWQSAVAVRNGGSPSDLASDLDNLEDLLLRAGYPAGLSGVRSIPSALPGLGGGHPQLEFFGCPAATCLRVEPLDGDVPVCPVLDKPLRRLRLGDS